MKPLQLTASLLASLLSTEIYEESSTVGSEVTNLWNSIQEKVRKELEQDETAKLALDRIETSGYKDFSRRNLENIAETLQEIIVENPELAKDLEESQKALQKELESTNITVYQRYLTLLDKIVTSFDRLQDIKNININIDRGDYLGKDPVILSGNSNVFQFQSQSGIINESIFNNNESIFDNEEYTDRILCQTEQIKGKITQFFTVKESMDKLDEIRQPRAILTGYVEQELKVNIPIPIFGDFSLRRLFKNRKENQTVKPLMKLLHLAQKTRCFNVPDARIPNF